MNRKGFTLIELLAVIVILGVIMTIAIPNVVSSLDRNKKDSMIEDAKQMISAAQYKISSDTSIDYPDLYDVIIFRLKDLDAISLEVSSYDTYYSQDKSFVAITKDKVTDEDGVESMKYIYYAHLISCKEEDCAHASDTKEEENRGIRLSAEDWLTSNDRYELVIKGSELEYDLVDSTGAIKASLGKDRVTYYERNDK